MPARSLNENADRESRFAKPARKKGSKPANPPGGQPVPARKIRIFIADDHPLVRKGLQTLLNLQPDMQVCGDAGGILSGMGRIGKTRPDVVILDLVLEDGDGFELLRRLHREQPHIKTVVFTSQASARCAQRAIKCGAGGYVLKYDGWQDLLRTIRKVTRSLRGLRRLSRGNRAPQRREAKA